MRETATKKSFQLLLQFTSFKFMVRMGVKDTNFGIYIRVEKCLLVISYLDIFPGGFSPLLSKTSVAWDVAALRFALFF